MKRIKVKPKVKVTQTKKKPIKMRVYGSVGLAPKKMIKFRLEIIKKKKEDEQKKASEKDRSDNG